METNVIGINPKFFSALEIEAETGLKAVLLSPADEIEVEILVE